MAKKNELATRSGVALAVGNGAINEMFGSDGSYQLPIDAPLPAFGIVRETAQFLTPDGETCKEFTGHILHWHNANQYWKEPFSGDNSNPPDCFSPDGMLPDDGETIQNGPCAACSLNQYGSAVNKDGTESRGKACQNTIRLYVLVDGEMIPVLIKAPPSSLGKKESLPKFLTNLPNVTAKAGVGTVYQLVRVRFSLYKKQFEAGEASILKPEASAVLNPENADDMAEIKRRAKLTRMCKEVFTKSRIAEDMVKEKSDGDVIDAEGTSQPAGDDVPI